MNTACGDDDGSGNDDDGAAGVGGSAGRGVGGSSATSGSSGGGRGGIGGAPAGGTTAGGTTTGGTTTGGTTTGGRPSTGGGSAECDRAAVVSCRTPPTGGLEICVEAHETGASSQVVTAQCGSMMVTQGNCAKTGNYVGHCSGGISTYYYTDDAQMASSLQSACTAISGTWCPP